MSIRKLGPSFRVLMEKSAVLDIFPTVSQPTARAFVMDRSLWYFKGKKLFSPLPLLKEEYGLLGGQV